MTSRARSQIAPYNNLILGTAPDSWGVWFPEDDKQVTWKTFLDEVAEAGYEFIETGPFGFLPTDPQVLREETDKRGIRVVAGTQGATLHKPDEYDAAEKSLRGVAAVLKALDARFLVYLPPQLRDLHTGGWIEDPNMSDEQLAIFAENANRVGKILKDEYNVTFSVHSHGDSHLETREQIERFLDATDPEYVAFCLDTGHLEYGEVDTVDFIQAYADRISIVHIKQMDPEVVQKVREEDLSFGEAVSAGVCVTPDGGAPKVGPVIDALVGLEREIYVIVEQDLYPCAPDVPLPIATKTREVLAQNNLGTL